ncbi:MAG TPA: urea ABC transporter permease subunit UrtC [Chloroflexota bacterium]|nr:urea ABC transporter permease subunit UrtC [Chloroflexota bacterium]
MIVRQTQSRYAAQRIGGAALAVLALVILLLVLPNALSPFRLNLVGKYLCYALVALGLDLAWGYAGLLSLGQSVYFGLGAYAFGMYLKMESAHGTLPDFMGWSGLDALPGYWRPFNDPVFALAAAVLVPAGLAALFGYLMSRSRVSGVYFSIITQALAFIATTLFIGQQPFTGGTNGLTNFGTIFGQPLKEAAVQTQLFRVTVVALALCLAVALWLARSRFGRLLVAMRDDEQRLRFSGYNPTLLKAAVFGISGGMAGLAGALFAPQVGIVNPDSLGIILGIQMVIWVAVGGRGTLIGALLGAVAVNATQSAVSESFPDLWQYAIGALFVASVLIFPGGLVGALRSLPALGRKFAPPRPKPAQREHPGGTDPAPAELVQV